MSVHVMSTVWSINPSPSCLLNGSEFLNPNIIHLLNRVVVSTCLLDFIKMKKKKKKKNPNFSINQIDMNYEKPKK